MAIQEQIREMAKIICGRSKDDICLIDKTSCDWSCNWARQAEEIYNAGYRKVFSNKDNFTDLLNEEIKELYLIERTRKETAKEIYDLCCGHGTTFIKKYLKEKYGVEGEE